MRRMRVEFWITKATNIHPQYIILTAFLLQQWLHEYASILRYTHTIKSFRSKKFHLRICFPSAFFPLWFPKERLWHIFIFLSPNPHVQPTQPYNPHVQPIQLYNPHVQPIQPYNRDFIYKNKQYYSSKYQSCSSYRLTSPPQSIHKISCFIHFRFMTTKMELSPEPSCIWHTT